MNFVNDVEAAPGSDKSASKSIRIRPELRAAQVGRARRMVPATTLYFNEKYDLGQTELPKSFHKVTLLQCLRILASSDAEVLEVPEPLWLRFAFKNFLMLSVWKLFGFFSSNKRIAVTYAIENNGLDNLISPRRRVSPGVKRLFGVAAGTAMRLTLDRIAFGSTASKDLYHSLPGVRGISCQLIEELPAMDTDVRHRGQSRNNEQRAIFIGELDDRKGVIELMTAWPSVESSIPGAVLTLVGDGKYGAAVQQWCEERPQSRSYRGFVQHDQTGELLFDSDVLVAPSRRAGRWREQIGLPIVEALSFGLTVVTTDETGLAAWLRDHGHTVIPEPDVKPALADAMARALNAPLRREDVFLSLPVIPGRIAADSWLHTFEVSDAIEDGK